MLLIHQFVVWGLEHELWEVISTTALVVINSQHSQTSKCSQMPISNNYVLWEFILFYSLEEKCGGEWVGWGWGWGRCFLIYFFPTWLTVFGPGLWAAGDAVECLIVRPWMCACHSEKAKKSKVKYFLNWLTWKPACGRGGGFVLVRPLCSTSLQQPHHEPMGYISTTGSFKQIYFPGSQM